MRSLVAPSRWSLGSAARAVKRRRASVQSWLRNGTSARLKRASQKSGSISRALRNAVSALPIFSQAHPGHAAEILRRCHIGLAGVDRVEFLERLAIVSGVQLLGRGGIHLLEFRRRRRHHVGREGTQNQKKNRRAFPRFCHHRIKFVPLAADKI